MGAEYSQLDNLSYPDAATLIKRHHGNSKRSYCVNKVQMTAMKNIPYARYVPLSDRKTQEYKNTLYTPKVSRKAVTSLDASFSRSKSSMPAPGRSPEGEVTFVRGASIRKTRRGRAKSAFVPQSEKELALSKIYIKPSDLVIEQPKPKKPPKKNNKEKKKRLPFFRIKKKNQIQPGTVYIEPGRSKRKPISTNHVYNIFQPLPNIARRPSIRSRPSTQGASRPSTRGSIRRKSTQTPDVSFSSTSTAMSAKRGKKSGSHSNSKDKLSDSDSLSSYSEDELQFSEQSKDGAILANNVKAKAKLFQVKGSKSSQSPTRKQSTDKSQRPKTVHGLPYHRRDRPLDLTNRPKTTRSARSPYDLFSTTQPVSRASTPGAKSPNKLVNNTSVKKASASRKSFVNSVHPFGQIVSKKPSTPQSQQGKIQKGAPSKVKQKQKIRLKWYNVLQRTHYEKKVDSLYNKQKGMATESRDNTCNEDELDTKLGRKTAQSNRSLVASNKYTKSSDSTTKLKSQSNIEIATQKPPNTESITANQKTQRPQITITPEKSQAESVIKVRPQSAKSDISVSGEKPTEYDADLESDMEKVNSQKVKNTPMMVRRAKARQALSNALSRSGSRATDVGILSPKPATPSAIPKSPRPVRFQSPRSRRDSSRYRAEERKLQMYPDSSSSSEEDEILKQMNNFGLSPRSADRSASNVSTPKVLAPSWYSDSNPNLKELKDDNTNSSPSQRQRSSLNSTKDSNFVSLARTMFEYSTPTPDIGHVVTIQGCTDGKTVTVKQANDKVKSVGLAPKPATTKYVSLERDDNLNVTQHTSNKGQSASYGLSTVENKLSWTPTLGRHSRRDHWDQTNSYPTTNSITSVQNRNKYAPNKPESNHSHKSANGQNQDNIPSEKSPKLNTKSELVEAKPYISPGVSLRSEHGRSKSRENRSVVNTDMFGNKYRRERSNPRTNLVQSTGIYSNNYESVGNSSQGQGLTLPKLVTVDGYDAFARTAPGSKPRDSGSKQRDVSESRTKPRESGSAMREVIESANKVRDSRSRYRDLNETGTKTYESGPRPREFSPMNWARHGTNVQNTKPCRPNTYHWRSESPEKKPVNKSTNSVFKQILQSMLENTQDANSMRTADKRAETAPTNMRRRDSSIETYLPAVVNNTGPSNNLVECTKL